MSKPKNSLLIVMRKIATTSRAYYNLPALLALADCLNFMHKHQESHCFIFTKMICNPSYFHLSFENLAPICFSGEKTVRNKCKIFIKYFYVEYSYFKTLPLPQLIARLTEYRSNNFLRQNIPSLNTISVDDITKAIFSYNANPGDKQLSLSFISEFKEITIGGVL